MGSRARVEHQPVAAAGNGLVVAVGLGVAFLLFMAFLNMAKSGSLFSESNLLFVALIFYAGAAALYLGFGATGAERCVRFASLATAAVVVCCTPLATNSFNAADKYFLRLSSLRWRTMKIFSLIL